ncbi:HIT family protein [Paraburkholderia dinghuensis]|uniref:HIT family protein n=1 Tax=Paraburkholderia dinghuensis TaxID=2305225 RepID=A0A3N6M839_9BURK|nr:HIT family protein [Paraburkholderia dinghuensis]RQG99818.1 HIT family protein [Paraburkholderia dinghuensis]
MTVACPFCTLPSERIVGENSHAFWIYDGFPVSPKHALIIPKRHVPSLFETADDERAALWQLLFIAKQVIGQSKAPDGFNIGINDGYAAGQTVPHLHIHLIPRYGGDQDDPRGGIRKIFPEKADYWSPVD